MTTAIQTQRPCPWTAILHPALHSFRMWTLSVPPVSWSSPAQVCPSQSHRLLDTVFTSARSRDGLLLCLQPQAHSYPPLFSSEYQPAQNKIPHHLFKIFSAHYSLCTAFPSTITPHINVFVSNSRLSHLPFLANQPCFLIDSNTWVFFSQKDDTQTHHAQGVLGLLTTWFQLPGIPSPHLC